jgi:transposase-like protein/predicted acylesterase/phospholipase RssA
VVAVALTATALSITEVVRRLVESGQGLRTPLIDVPGAANKRAYEKSSDERTIGIALSGGGYRASLFALGSLMYLHEACLLANSPRRRIAAIVSVSGGSVTNGLAAHTLRIGRDDNDALDAMCKRLIRHATRTGSMFVGLRALSYYGGLLLTMVLVVLLAWLGVRYITWAIAWRAAALVAIPLVAWGIALLGQNVKRPKSTWAETATTVLFILAPLLVVPVLLVLASGAPPWRHAMAWIAASFLLAMATAAFWALRGRLIQHTFDSLLRDGGPSPLLRGAHGETHHVFCATEVQFGETAYLAHDQVRSRHFDRVGPGRLPTAAAVRASAAFPGAFPPFLLTGVTGKNSAGLRERDREGELSTRHMTLVDGGVRDNLGVSWFEIAPDLDQIVVVSAAANRHAFRSVQRLVGVAELLSLLNIINIPYNTRERYRRRAVSAQYFGKAWTDASQESAGALIHIEDTPYDLAWKLRAKKSGASEAGTWMDMSRLPPWDVEQWLAVERLWSSAGKHADVLAERAEAVIEHLDAIEAQLPAAPRLTTSDYLSLRVATMQSPLGGDWSGGGSDAQAAWWMRTRANTLVGTKLSRIASMEAMNLVLQGYYLTMANLHIAAGWPLTVALNMVRLDDLFEGTLSAPALEQRHRELIARSEALNTRALPPHYPIVIFWANTVRVREAGELRNKVGASAVGVTERGTLELLHAAIAPTWRDSGLTPITHGPLVVREAAIKASRAFWQKFAADLKQRGLQDIDVMVREIKWSRVFHEELIGLDEAIASSFPGASIQPRVVALIRSLVVWLNLEESKLVTDDLRGIFFASNEAQAIERYAQFGEKWGVAEESLYKNLHESWEDILPSYALSAETRLFLERIDNLLVELSFEISKRVDARGAVANGALALAHLLDDVQVLKLEGRTKPSWVHSLAQMRRETRDRKEGKGSFSRSD